jgi:hypothetical protein
MCSFWLVEALTRAGRTDPQRLEDARLMFEQVLGQANHLRLYSGDSATHFYAAGWEEWDDWSPPDRWKVGCTCSS